MLSKIKKIVKNSKAFEQVDKLENKHYQKNLTNHEFTILCPNCIGGLIYHRLGERFDSPTIDLSINTDEYCCFLKNLDFYLEKDNDKYLVEVKGCTLEQKHIGYFPDAPTERGVKHIYELIEARKKGFKCALAFVIQMPQVNEVKPNILIQPEFGTAWKDALNAGVKIWFLGCDVSEDKLSINDSRVTFDL